MTDGTPDTWTGETFAVSLGTNSEAEKRLMDYWAHGEGAAKIGWARDGSFNRCVRRLRKYFPRDPKGLCANLHKRATGEWPAEKGIDS